MGINNNGEKVYCKLCPIQEVCYGKGCTPDSETPANECVLAKLYYGELKVESVGYVTRH